VSVELTLAATNITGNCNPTPVRNRPLDRAVLARPINVLYLSAVVF
jgi:hypothetical protein